MESINSSTGGRGNISPIGPVWDHTDPANDMQPAELAMGELATYERENFTFPAMTSVTGRGHHGRRGVNFVAVGTLNHWVAGLVADVAAKLVHGLS